MAGSTDRPQDAAARSVEARLRAALDGGDRDELRALYEQLGRPRVEVPGLAEEVRAAIVHAYVPVCAEHSDPRWRAEALCTEPPPPVDSAERLGRAGAALAALGVDPWPPMPCGLYHDAGYGNFDVILYDNGRGDPDRPGELFVSQLGLFVNGDDWDDRYRVALTEAGFHWIDERTGGVRVTGLGVRYFGEWKELCIDLLLFQWQD
ncbi:hypothetical protein [Kitasatospora purpeofusca]|uniref:SMI1/KNR4 family protein n=1 Tax=Kitasatospora purpeofusca TaxID=67352 RepID=A0ABZ1U8U1_9ACTN|nr:hypothetical protein [Kitasatospora purpeofusca]